MSSATVMIASISLHPSMGEAASFILVGFLFVSIVLLVLAGVTSAIGLLFKGVGQPKPKPAPVPAASAPSPPEAASGEPMDEEEARRMAAVVAAAVHTVMGAPHRIVSIRPTQGGWAQEGRRSIFSSHNVRR